MSTNLVTKPFTLLTTKELEQALNSIQLKEETLFKLKSNDTVGYDLTFEIDTYLKQIDIQNIHEINLIKKFVNKNINDQLKLTIKLNQNQQIVIQLDNDVNILLNEIIEYISKIESVKQDEIFLSPMDSNELLLPSVKIVKLILEQPNQYSILKLFDKSTMNSDNTNKHSLRYYNNKTNLDRDIYAISYNKFSSSNTARNSSTLLQEKFNISEINDKNPINENDYNNKNALNYQKKYNNYTKNEKEEINSNNNDNNSNNNTQINHYQYSHNLNNKSKSHSNLINQNQQSMNHTNSETDNVSPFPSTSREVFNNNNNNNITNLKAKSYTTYNSITEKYRKYGTNIDDKENNDNINKDEYNQYLKKGYGFYQPLTSNDKNDSLNENVQNSKRENEQEGEIESPQPNNHMKIETNNLGININVNNKDSRKYSSERRNYRQYEGSRTPDHNNNIDLYKKYDKYSSNNDNDNDNKQYALSPNYNQRHLKGSNIVTPSNITTNNTNTTNPNVTANNNTNNNISAYELRNKVNSMRNQLNAYASLNPVNNNKNGESHKKESFKTSNSNNCLNYKLFPKENDDSNDNISNDNLNNVDIDSSANKESRGYSKRPFKYES